MGRGRSNNGQDCHPIQIEEIEEVIHPAAENETARSNVGSIGEDQLDLMTKRERSIPSTVQAVARSRSLDKSAGSCLVDVLCRLEQRDIQVKERNCVEAKASLCTIFRLPQSLGEIDLNAAEPEIVSIGPYHRGKQQTREFEEQKWFFFERFRPRTKLDVESLIKLVADKESSARDCYSEAVHMPSSEFIEMMLLDGCFVVELLLHISRIYRRGNKIEKDDPIQSSSIIRTLTRDLLRLENQVPYFLLQMLFDLSSSTKLEAKTPHLCMLALRVFNPYMLALRVFNRSEGYTDLQYRNYSEITSKKYEHLLDLFHFNLSLTNSVQRHPKQQPEQQGSGYQSDGPRLRGQEVRFFSSSFFKKVTFLFDRPKWGAREQESVQQSDEQSDQQYRPSPQSIPCVTQLRPSGIEFKPNKTVGFLDISFRKSFRKRVLEIPYIAFDDFMITALINCIALEQSQEKRSKHVTDYVSFMLCLINEPKDVSLLCSDGIISTLSRDDQYVVDLFKKLGKSIVFNVCDRRLSKQFEELELYYQGNGASMIRTYFSSPWSAISVFTASLILALTIIQTVFAVIK